MDHSKQRYYRARKFDGRFKGEVFHYDNSGNYVVTVWMSPDYYDTEEEAVDATADWIESSGIEDQVGEVRWG